MDRDGIRGGRGEEGMDVWISRGFSRANALV